MLPRAEARARGFGCRPGHSGLRICDRSCANASSLLKRGHRRIHPGDVWPRARAGDRRFEWSVFGSRLSCCPRPYYRSAPPLCLPVAVPGVRLVEAAAEQNSLPGRLAARPVTGVLIGCGPGSRGRTQEASQAQPEANRVAAAEQMRSSLPNKAAEADGRKRRRNRSAVSVRVPRGGSPMVSFMPAAA